MTIKFELWWIIADESNGRMSYLKAECKSAISANLKMLELMEKEPKLRFHMVQIY